VFHNIPDYVLARMRYLEGIDARDRSDGTPRLSRLRQISQPVGQFLAVLAASAPAGRFLEVGTSAGYSTVWLSLACREVGQKITTFEVLPEKAMIARETIAAAQMADVVELVHGDALELLPKYDQISFCFLDAEKEVYQKAYELIVPRMAKGGILVADNAISHKTELQSVIDQALRDDRVDALVVPIGSGELICRRK